ncbi:MobA/MobL family protein, partial [Azospirillum isscasi]
MTTHTHIRFGTVSRAATTERATGGNAVALSAYHAAARYEASDGRVFDFARKRNELVTETRVLLPDGAPAWAADPATLWRAAESADKRRDACIARWIEVSVPRAVPKELTAGFGEAVGRMLSERYGVAVQVDAHRVKASDGGTNDHAHLLIATRVFDGDKFGKKSSALDQGFRARRGRDMRVAVAEAANKFLAEHGIDEARLNPEKQAGPVPPERNVSRRAVEAWKKNPDDAEVYGSVIAARPVRRQLRAARRVAVQSVQEVAALAATHERCALTVRPRRVRPGPPWIEVEPRGPIVAVSRRADAIALRLADGAVVIQRQDAIRLRSGRPSGGAVATMADRAVAAGWTEVTLSGTDPSQRDRLAAALAARGITVVGEARP